MSYEQGFMDKCAEYGVDPRELVKYAQASPPAQQPSMMDTVGSLMLPGYGISKAIGQGIGKFAPNIHAVMSPGGYMLNRMVRNTIQDQKNNQPPYALQEAVMPQAQYPQYQEYPQYPQYPQYYYQPGGY